MPRKRDEVDNEATQAYRAGLLKGRETISNLMAIAGHKLFEIEAVEEQAARDALGGVAFYSGSQYWVKPEDLVRYVTMELTALVAARKVARAAKRKSPAS